MQKEHRNGNSKRQSPQRWTARHPTYNAHFTLRLNYGTKSPPPPRTSRGTGGGGGTVGATPCRQSSAFAGPRRSTLRRTAGAYRRPALSPFGCGAMTIGKAPPDPPRQRRGRAVHARHAGPPRPPPSLPPVGGTTCASRSVLLRRWEAGGAHTRPTARRRGAAVGPQYPPDRSRRSCGGLAPRLRWHWPAPWHCGGDNQRCIRTGGRGV